MSSGSIISFDENCVWIHANICWKKFPCANPLKCDFHIGLFNIKLQKEASFSDFESILMKGIEQQGVTDMNKMRLLNIQRIPEGYQRVLFVDISYQPDGMDTVRLNVEQIVKKWPENLQWNSEKTFIELIENWIEFDKTLISTDQKIDNFDWKLTQEENESR